MEEGAPRRLDLAIGGLARSGTTVVQRLVGELAAVRVAPETHLWRHASRLVAGHPPPWDRDAAVAAVAALAAMPSTDMLEVDVDDVVDRMPGTDAYLWDLYEALCSSLVGLRPGDGTLVAEKTPDHALWFDQLLDVVPTLRVLLVVRDPRAVLRSHRGVPWGISDAAPLAEKWAGHARTADRLRAAAPDRVLVARFEDVAAAPDEFRNRVAGFLGVADELDPRQPEPAISEEEWWRRSASGSIRTREARWQGELAREDIAVVEAVAGEQLSRWGYEPAGPDVVTGVASGDDDVRRTVETIRTTTLPVTASSAWPPVDASARSSAAPTAEGHAHDPTVGERLRAAVMRLRAVVTGQR